MSAPAPANWRSGLGNRRSNDPHGGAKVNVTRSPQPAEEKRRITSTPHSLLNKFDYCRFIELDYVPMERGYMVSMRPTKGYTSTKSPTKGYTFTKSPDRHSRSTNSPFSPQSRRTPAVPSNRDSSGNASLSGSSNSSSCKVNDCSPTKGRHHKYMSCTDNHGIRPPPPEQYLTPLQQKEVCIRHLRARLKETINTLQDRDTEIDVLRGQLYRMQEDWVEEECHRVEAQLALKEARQEIQQLKQAVDTVRVRLSDAGGVSGDIGVQKYFHDINTQNHKLENLLINMELAQAGLAKEGKAIPGCRTRVGAGSAPASVSGDGQGGLSKPAVGVRGSCSCDGSPAHSLTRSSTYTKLSDQALADRNGNGPQFPCLSGDGTQDSGFECCGESSLPSQTDLLLEAAFLSEETASLLNSYTQTFSYSQPNSFSHTLTHSFPQNLFNSVPHTMSHSSTYETLCAGERLAPFRCGLGCKSHPCLSHHHLYLHPLQEMGIQTESCPITATAGYPSDLDTIAEQRTFRSQACSPTSTWLSDEGGGELDSITTSASVTTATITLMQSATVACSMKSPLCGGNEGLEEEEIQEKEKSERKSSTEKQGKTTVIRMAEARQHTQMGSVDGNEVEGQGVVEAETSVEIQGELMFGRFYGEDLQGGITLENISMEDRQQNICLSEGLTQVEIAELGQNHRGLAPGIEQPHTSQPRRSTSLEEIAGVTVVEVHDEDDDEDETQEQGAIAEEGDPSDSGAIQKSYWSRHFLVDLLAVAIPVVPTVAWLCRGPVRGGQPMYHIGSLLRGCCTVALHSLRRGVGLRHYPAGGGDMGSSLL